MKLYLQNLEATSLEMDQILEAKYHHACKRKYTNKASDAKNSGKSNLFSDKKAKSAALNDLIAFVNKRVIEKKTTNGSISVAREVQKSIHY